VRWADAARTTLAWLVGVTSLGAGAGAPRAQPSEPLVPVGIEDVTELDLEDLLNQGVTSVSKKQERLMGAPAAIYVVRGEDIRRTCVRTLAEALAMVPGLQVARLASNLWTVTSRGFADITANKLLVLIDGRTVYTPSFAGVWWDVQDVMLEDVDRIEVIRGPGGTMWGANAVNGVVNVVTRGAAQTTGLLATAGGGTTDRGFAAVRQGLQLSPTLHARVYAKAFDWDTPGQAGDHFWQARAGFRADWQPRPGDTLTVQGDGYTGDGQFTLRSPTLMPPYSEVVEGAGKVSGGNVLGRYTRALGTASELSLQAFYDFTGRSGQLHGERRHTADVQFQHRFPLLGRHDVVWGLEYRIGHDDIDNSFTISFDPTSGTQQLASVFVQDELTLVPERLRATLGSKLEYHSYTGLEWQPNARLSFTPHARHGLWAAVSRAVRTPARNERDVRVNRGAFGGMTPVLVSILGSRNYGSEILWAYEAGYRVNPVDPFTLDVTAFYDRYHRLRSLEPQPSVAENDPPPQHLLVALLAQNRLSGQVMGAEGTARWQVLPRLRLELSYSHLRMNLTPDPGSMDTESKDIEGHSPRHQVYGRSSIDLPLGLELDGMVHWVDRLPSINIASYVDLDVRLGWRPDPRWELAIVGQNLLRPWRKEYEATLLTVDAIQVRRAVYGSVTLRY
jgi:iron complex outermembrane receptor protein